MPIQSFRVGVAGVRLSKKTSAVIATPAAVPFTPVFVASPSNLELNSIDTGLPTSTTIKVCFGLLGRDATYGGYTVSPVSAESAAITTAPDGVIKVTILNADFTSNFAKAAALVLFIKEGAGDYQIARFAYIDPAKDFIAHIMTMPVGGAQSYPYATLSGSTPDEDLGSRAPYGYDYVVLSPTTGGVQVIREVDEATLDPDTARAFTVATTRSVRVEFNLMANNVLDVVRAAGGNYVRNTHSSIEYEESLQCIATANAVITGNQPFMLIMPRDPQGFQERRLYLGGLTTSQVGFTEAWLKSANASIPYVFTTAIMDKLLLDQFCEIVYKRKG